MKFFLETYVPLGLFEAGFGPGIPFLLSFFYLRHELGIRISVFLSCAPLATTFAGALAYGITNGSSRLANWRLLFLVEGLPTILMAFVAYFFLPVSPDKARFLNYEEACVAKARGVRQVGDVERVGSIVWTDIGGALLDVKNWFTAVCRLSSRASGPRKYSDLCNHAINIPSLRRISQERWLTVVQLMYFSTNVGFSSLPGKCICESRFKQLSG